VGFLDSCRGRCRGTYEGFLQDYELGQKSKDVYGPYDASGSSSGLELTVNGVNMPEKPMDKRVGGVTEFAPRPEGGHKPIGSYLNSLWKGAKQKYAGFHEWRHRQDLLDYPYLIDGAKAKYGDAARLVIEALTEIQTRYEHPELVKKAGVKAYQNYVDLFKNLAGGDLMKKVEEIKADCNDAGKRAYEAGKKGYGDIKRTIPSLDYASAYSRSICSAPCGCSRKYGC